MIKKLITVSIIFASTLVSADFKSDAVTAHNKWRNNLNMGELSNQPRPSPFIQNVIWDEKLADRARAHTAKCVWEHSGSGENMYAQGGRGGTITAGVNLWGEEYKNYDYASHSSTGGQIGHYTQLVWGNSTKIGCAVNYCSPIKHPDGRTLWTGEMFSCNYSPPGNYNNQRPYGTSGYRGNEFSSYNAENGDVEVPTITYQGNMYRLKMSRIGSWEKYYDFDFTAYEHLYASNRTNTSKLYQDSNNVFKLVIEFDTFTAYLTQLESGLLKFRLTEIKNK